MNKRHENRFPTGSEFCNGKKDYPTHAEAARAAKNIRRYQSERVHEFWCSVCKAWHIGYSPILRKPKLRDDDDLDSVEETWYDEVTPRREEFL